MKLTIDKKLCESIVETRDTHLQTSISVCLVVILHVFAGSFWKKKKKLCHHHTLATLRQLEMQTGWIQTGTMVDPYPEPILDPNPDPTQNQCLVSGYSINLKKKTDNMFVSTDSVR